MKTCTACNQSKPLDAFVRRYKARDGRASICRACFSDKIKATRALPKTPAEKDASASVDLQARRCTCQPRHIEGFIAHDATCMIFAHNQLDPRFSRDGTTIESAWLVWKH